MNNTFFKSTYEINEIASRIREIETGKVGFYSIGLYPASLAYNCAMQAHGSSLLLAPRIDRDIFGAFPSDILDGMDSKHVKSVYNMSKHIEGNELVTNSLADLILRCELVVLSSNSNHIENDIRQACTLREELQRQNVVLAILSGSFNHNTSSNESYVLCEKLTNLAFFSGFHRHGSLRNPLDSFTANFCHPDALTALLGSRLLDKLSPNIQVSSGVHNVEGQYIKAAKNMSSILAGFGHEYHKDNPGVLPTLLTLLLDQCLDQAASVSMCRKDRDHLYNHQPFPLTELGYGVQKIEAALVKDGDMQMVRDHTFAQLTAMVADVRGSMMLPISGMPTRNFQAGQILAERMKTLKRCPENVEELIEWCQSKGLSRGGLEGLNSMKYWPQIIKKYNIPSHDSSMLNLLYISIYAPRNVKKIAYNVLTQSRELTSYCQESVRPNHSRRITEALNDLSNQSSMELIVKSVITTNNRLDDLESSRTTEFFVDHQSSSHIQAMVAIDKIL